MNWTENGEGKRVYEWVCQNQEFFPFQESTPLAETYYCPFDNTSNVCSYGFESIPELEKKLEELWHDNPIFCSIIRTCAVAMFKRQPTHIQVKEEQKDSENSLKIPDFVYIF